MSQKDWWNARFKNDGSMIRGDFYAKMDAKVALTDKVWISEWSGFDKHITSRIGGGQPKPTLLDLGCGLGQLAKYFDGLGFDVTAADFSENALEVLWSHSPHIRTLVHDMTNPLPFGDGSFNVVVANLTLHYFCERDTRSIVSEVMRVLKPNGLLVGAVVSSQDYEKVKDRGCFVEIEPGFYHEVFNDTKKHIRFFSRDDIDKFFGGFEKLYLDNKFEQRMGKSKGAWEFVFRKQIYVDNKRFVSNGELT